MGYFTLYMGLSTNLVLNISIIEHRNNTLYIFCFNKCMRFYE